MKKDMILSLKKPLNLLPFLALVFTLMSFSAGRIVSRHAIKPAAFFVSPDAGLWLSKYGFPAGKNQDMNQALDVLDRCIRIYSDTKKFKLDVEYSVFFDSENFDEPSDKKSGKIIRDKDDFFQDEMGNIRVLNKDYELILNQRGEFMTVRNRMKKKIEPVNFETDSLAKFVTHAEKSDEGYTYFMKEGAIEKFEVITYPDGSLKIWRSYHRDKMDFGEGEVKVITQLHYLNFEKNPKTDPAVFSLEPYVAISKKGEVKAREKYKNFYVLNQIQKL